MNGENHPVPRLNAALSALLITLALSGCAVFKKDKKQPESELAPSRVNMIGVNTWLWRASLDTISFMPIAQVDSNGGVIVTDWYVNPKAPGERVKVSIFILDQDLRADALKVSAQRQERVGGNWVDAPVRAGTVQKLEETILGKARDLRRSALEG